MRLDFYGQCFGVKYYEENVSSFLQFHQALSLLKTKLVFA